MKQKTGKLFMFCLLAGVVEFLSQQTSLALPQAQGREPKSLLLSFGDKDETVLVDEAKLAGSEEATSRFKRDTNPKKKNKQLVSECLAAHNKLRRLHNVPDLVWDDKIAAFAQKRSNFIAKSDGVEFKHPPDLPYGENLFWHSSLKFTCDQMVRGWYDEISLYDYNKAEFTHEAGHFTQVVWKNTKRVGCATAISNGKRGGIYLTCNYDPPGNYLGEFKENVPTTTGGGVASVNKSTTTTTTTTSTTTTTTIKPTIGAHPLTTTPAPGGTGGPNKQETTKPKKKGNKKKNNKKKRNKKKKKNKKKSTTTTTSAPVSITTARSSG